MKIHTYEKCERKKAPKPKKTRPDNRSIGQVVAEMDEYNRKNGTRLTYGKYVELMHR